MEANGKLNILSTTGMINDLVSEIGGEKINSLCLIGGALDPHSYELIKGDDEKLSQANLIFYNGLGLEHGASLRRHLEKHPKAIPLGNVLYQENPELFIKIDGQLDPHFWMDVALFAKVIDPIVEALAEQDPAHATFYQERGVNLKEKMLKQDQSFSEKIQKIPPEKRYLISSHDAFYYFAKKYLAVPENMDWETRFMAPEGFAPDGQMSICDIQKVTEFLCKHQIQVVFPESNVSQDALKKIIAICREKGLHVKIAATPLYGDTMGEKGSGADTYLDMIEHNVDLLSSLLSQNF